MLSEEVVVPVTFPDTELGRSAWGLGPSPSPRSEGTRSDLSLRKTPHGAGSRRMARGQPPRQRRRRWPCGGTQGMKGTQGLGVGGGGQ